MMGPPMTLGYENVGRDACAGCGESTAVGTVHFSDRRTLPDGTRLCATCNAMAAAHHGRQRLTDKEVRQLINNGSMAGITWANDHI
jgi:glycerol-3-phosphate dehydrogenase